MDPDSGVVTIENGSAAFSFDRGSGALVSVRNRVTGNEYLQGTAERGNVFAVYYDFTGEFEITGAERESPHAATLAAAISDSVFSPFQAGTPRFARGGSGDTRTLTVEYDCGDRSAPLRARVGVSLGPDADSSIWSLALTNIGAAPVTCMCSFPLLSGLRLGSGDGNLMVVNDQAGYVLPLWAHSGGTYGNARYMSMQWGCVFDERNRDAFGFIVRDPDIRNKQIRYLEPSIEVSYFPPFSIPPGETVTFPEVEIMVYTGDWKRAAQRYRHWFSGNVGSVRHADWARRIDGHGAGWFEKRGQSNPEGYPHVMLPLDRFEDLPELYHAVPVDCQEYAFHCSRSQPAEITGKRMLWTDADNVIRGDLGGAPALREGIRRIHELGYHFTFYVEGYLCPGDAEIVRRQGAREWAVMNRDGSNFGAYTREGENLGCGLLHLCTGCAEWQDHLARTAARLVRETGADGVRLDSLGFYGFPCYHPGHRHESPFDYNRWLQQMLQKVAAAVRKENPDCLLTTEGGADFFGRHFDGALTQQFIPRRVAVSRDVSPMRIAVPEYLVLWHVTSGPVAASLSGYPGGSASTISTSPRFMELDRKWRCARYPVADVIRWGNAVHDNPTADRPDVTCRRFSAENAGRHRRRPAALPQRLGAGHRPGRLDPARRRHERRGRPHGRPRLLSRHRRDARPTAPERRSVRRRTAERDGGRSIRGRPDGDVRGRLQLVHGRARVRGERSGRGDRSAGAPAAGRCRGRHRLAARGRGAAELHRHALGTVTGVARAAPGNGPRHVRAADSGDGRFRLPPDSACLRRLSRG